MSNPTVLPAAASQLNPTSNLSSFAARWLVAIGGFMLALGMCGTTSLGTAEHSRWFSVVVLMLAVFGPVMMGLGYHGLFAQGKARAAQVVGNFVLAVALVNFGRGEPTGFNGLMMAGALIVFAAGHLRAKGAPGIFAMLTLFVVLADVQQTIRSGKADPGFAILVELGVALVGISVALAPTSIEAAQEVTD